MKIISVWVLSLCLAGCVCLASNNEPAVETVSDTCFQYGEQAMKSTAEKWFHRPTIKDKNEGWRLVGLTSQQTLAKLGFSADDITAFAKSIYYNDLMSDKDRDALSFRYYMKFTCDLHETAAWIPQIRSVKEGIKRCWQSDEKQVESCISSVVYLASEAEI